MCRAEKGSDKRPPEFVYNEREACLERLVSIQETLITASIFIRHLAEQHCKPPWLTR